jgi:uncharacterized protein
MDQIIKYKCTKCGNSQYTIGEMWTSSSFVTKFLGFENRRFTYISCNMCHFTEIYKVPMKKIAEVLNFMAR